jgi:predicted RNase H-like HicB family nuclease
MQAIETKSYELKSLQEFQGGVCECRAAFIVDEEEGGYTVVARNLPGVVSEGDDIESAIENIKDAFREMVLSYKDSGEEIPWVDGGVEVFGQVAVEMRLLVKL